VDLGDRSYPIVFQGLEKLGEALKRYHNVGKCVLVSNDVVGPLYAGKVLGSLEAAGWSPEYIELPDGENKKTPETYVFLVNKILDMQVDRKTPVIALGGGVTTDIVGFAAATTLRGLPFANVPTTLLAQVDASVGGKTGVNTAHGKNLLGAFWQPFLVFIAVQTLETLSDPEFRCGLGEVIKHAVLDEKPDRFDKNKLVPSTDFFEWLETNAESVVGRNTNALNYAIRRCCEIKAAIVSADERESGKRALLNLGHTVGHAVESVLGYGALRHGEAVSIGTLAEIQLGVTKGLCDPSLPDRFAQLALKLSLPTGYKGLNIAKLVDASFMDKKREKSHISVAIPYAIGDVRLVKLTPGDLLPAFQNIESNADISLSKLPDVQKHPGSPPSSPSRGVSSNAYANGSNQNAGNVLTDRPTTRVHQPPGGASSIIFG